MSMGRRRLWWDGVHEAFTGILWRHDPDGMGSSVGAPDDEYSDIAVSLMRQLLDKSEAQTVRDVVITKWPTWSPEMVAEIEGAWLPLPAE